MAKMTRKELVASAACLLQPPRSAAEEYQSKRDRLVVEMNEIMSARQDLEELVGWGNQASMEDNHRSHARVMGALFYVYNPEVFVDAWLRGLRSCRSHGFSPVYGREQLETWVGLLRDELSSYAFATIYPLYHWMTVHQPALAALSEKALTRRAGV